jgi:MFS transporter, ACS family, DAL5 transporter family protein
MANPVEQSKDLVVESSEKSPEIKDPLSSETIENGSQFDRKYEKALVRKLDRRLLPVLTLLYLLSFLDRSNGASFDRRIDSH